jgi:uncharacterized protein
MRRFEFEWDDGNVGHIAHHNVTPGEAEEVFESKYYLTRTWNSRYIAMGHTGAGRYLICVFERIGSGLIRIVTARDMSEGDRKLYKRKS